MPMDEWGVVVVIVTLMGMIGVVVGAVVYIVSSITKVTETSVHLQQEIVNERDLNIEAHRKIWERIDRQEAKIADHEKEIYGIKMMLDAEPD